MESQPQNPEFGTCNAKRQIAVIIQSMSLMAIYIPEFKILNSAHVMPNGNQLMNTSFSRDGNLSHNNFCFPKVAGEVRSVQILHTCSFSKVIGVSVS